MSTKQDNCQWLKDEVSSNLHQRKMLNPTLLKPGIRYLYKITVIK